MIIVGLDEAGRGPLAGPVMAAAVILDSNKPIDGLMDSKKLTEKKRESLYELIVRDALSYGIAQVDHQEIDEINILNASMLAMQRAFDYLTIKPDLALIDGNKCPELSCDSEAIIKGDSKIPEIMAASILAKVTRDRLMTEMDNKYPKYQFAKHKGYPTKLHRELIEQYGPCAIHRMSFTLTKRKKKAHID